jgi:hypothetical protein
MVVKLAASMPVSRSAMRHSTELPAKASMVRVVRRRVRAEGNSSGRLKLQFAIN